VAVGDTQAATGIFCWAVVTVISRFFVQSRTHM
jgi:hypothetical protein